MRAKTEQEGVTSYLKYSKSIFTADMALALDHVVQGDRSAGDQGHLLPLEILSQDTYTYKYTCVCVSSMLLPLQYHLSAPQLVIT